MSGLLARKLAPAQHKGQLLPVSELLFALGIPAPPHCHSPHCKLLPVSVEDLDSHHWPFWEGPYWCVVFQQVLPSAQDGVTSDYNGLLPPFITFHHLAGS